MIKSIKTKNKFEILHIPYKLISLLSGSYQNNIKIYNIRNLTQKIYNEYLKIIKIEMIHFFNLNYSFFISVKG